MAGFQFRFEIDGLLQRLLHCRVVWRSQCTHVHIVIIATTPTTPTTTTTTTIFTVIRCHPKISEIANKLVYDNQLLDGVTADERPPVIAGLLPVQCVDVGQSQEMRRGTSTCNEKEAIFSVWVIRQLCELGVRPEAIGIITTYRAQTFMIADKLQEVGLADVFVSTVDAFQVCPCNFSWFFSSSSLFSELYRGLGTLAVRTANLGWVVD